MSAQPPAPQPSRPTRLQYLDSTDPRYGGEQADVATDSPFPVRIYSGLGQPIDPLPSPQPVVLIAAGTNIVAAASNPQVFTTGLQVNPGYKGVALSWNITGHSGTSPTGSVAFVFGDPITGAQFGPFGTMTGVTTTNGLFVYELYPGLLAANVTTSAMGAVNACLPRLWAVQLSIGGTANPTYTCSLSYLYLP